MERARQMLKTYGRAGTVTYLALSSLVTTGALAKIRRLWDVHACSSIATLVNRASLYHSADAAARGLAACPVFLGSPTAPAHAPCCTPTATHLPKPLLRLLHRHPAKCGREKARWYQGWVRALPPHTAERLRCRSLRPPPSRRGLLLASVAVCFPICPCSPSLCCFMAPDAPAPPARVPATPPPAPSQRMIPRQSPRGCRSCCWARGRTFCSLSCAARPAYP
jgi:hypothetical protein